MNRTIGDGGINWNWYLNADFDDDNKTAFIHYYDRWHKFEFRGDNHPANVDWKNRLTLMQDDKRVVYGIKLGEIEYLVLNPAYVFSYKDKSTYIPEN